jgi:hypothetical protein
VHGTIGHYLLEYTTRTQAAAVLLLRLLAWKRVITIMTPSSLGGAAAAGGGEGEGALRYVFVAGMPGAGATTMYRCVTGLPQEYQVRRVGTS